MKNGEKSNAVNEVFDYCKQTKSKKALIQLLSGQIGNALAELMFGDDLPKLIEHLHENTQEKQNEIIKKLEDFMALRTNVSKPIIAIGSGYGEIIMESKDEVALGNKYTVEL